MKYLLIFIANLSANYSFTMQNPTLETLTAFQDSSSILSQRDTQILTNCQITSQQLKIKLNEIIEASNSMNTELFNKINLEIWFLIKNIFTTNNLTDEEYSVLDNISNVLNKTFTTY